MRLKHQQAGEATHPVDVGEALLFSGFGHQEEPTKNRRGRMAKQVFLERLARLESLRAFEFQIVATEFSGGGGRMGGDCRDRRVRWEPHGFARAAIFPRACHRGRSFWV